MTKSEIIEKLKSCDTLREAGLFWTKDVLDLIDGSPTGRSNDCDGACQEEIKKLKDENNALNNKVNRLSEANKQLRAENKQLKMRG